jgi:hypothetical protein
MATIQAAQTAISGIPRSIYKIMFFEYFIISEKLVKKHDFAQYRHKSSILEL